MFRSFARRTLATLAMALGGTTALAGTPADTPAQDATLQWYAPAFFETEEYFNNWGHAAIGTSRALAAGATGRGVVVGVIDSGFDPNHPELQGALHRDSIDIYGRSLLGPDSHGTNVASVIGGNLDGYGIHGVAPESVILGIRADVEGSCTPLCSFAYDGIAFATDYAVARGARVINYSLGGPSPTSEGLKQALKSARMAGTVLVFAAGNTPTKNPHFPGRNSRARWMQGHGIVVGALDPSGRIADFSARAGNAKHFYLVAPGVDIAVAAPGNTYELADGTSFAAPHVSGAAAGILSAWPWLRAPQVVEILLGTAIDLGAPGVDAIYGHGLLNVAGAFAPVGAARLPSGDDVGGGGQVITGAELRTGGAFGRTLASSRLLANAIVIDDYGRDFALDLTRLVRPDEGKVRADDWAGPAPEAHPFGARDGEAQTRLAFGQAPFGTHFGDQGGELQIERFALTDSVSETTSYALTRGFGIGGYFGLTASRGEAITGLLRHDAFGSPFLALVADGDGFVLGHEVADDLELRVGLTLQDGSSHPRHGAGERAPTSPSCAATGRAVRISARRSAWSTRRTVCSAPPRAARSR